MTEKLVIIGNGMAPGGCSSICSKPHPTATRSPSSMPNRASTTTASCCRRCCPARRHSRRSSSTATAGTSSTASPSTRATRSSPSTAQAKTVTSDHGVTESYDRLVIATGSVPFIIPVPGKDLPGVLTYRDLDDVNAMLLAAQSRAKAVVIGGGLLGLEAAAGLKERGMDVTVLHVMPTLMERQLDPAAGYLLQKAVEARGIKVMTKANTKAICRQRQGGRRRACRRHDHSGDAGRHGRRHPPQCRPGQGSRARGQSRHRRRPSHADFGSIDPRIRRMRGGRR